MSRFNTTIISPDAARTLLEKALFIDIQHQLADPSWWQQAYRAGHVPGAIFLPLDDALSAKPTGSNGRHPLPDRAAFARHMHAIGVRPGRQVIVYDQDTGAFAARAWWMLNRWLGYDNTALMDGGLAAWRAAGHIVSTESITSETLALHDAAQAPPLTADSPPVVTQTQVRANIVTSAFQIVDARGGERYRGESEPMDAVAGHIPGALNRPFTDNIGADGRFKPQYELRREWAGLLGDRSADQVVHQCGSGVTACHNMLAMEHAGLHGSRLYGGSWSEWSANPDNPMVRGPASA